MKRFTAAVLTTCGLLLGGLGLKAQQPAVIANPAGPAAPWFVAGACLPHSPTVCVREVKHHTKTVYACKTEEYCLPQRSFLSFLCGRGTCDDGHCSDVRIKHRLIVKKVADCDTTHCVPRPCGSACPK